MQFAELRGPQPPASGGPLLFAIAHTRSLRRLRPNAPRHSTFFRKEK